MSYKIIAIDAGATKTEVLITDGKSKLMLSVHPAINPNVIGFEESLDKMKKIINKYVSSDDQNEVILSAGISGMWDIRLRKHFTDELSKKTSLGAILIYPDIDITFASVFSGEDKNCGILIAGTGSVFYYRDSDGMMRKVGGWGRLIGDEGSGYWMGKEAIRKVCEYLDGRGKKTLLTEVFESKFKLNRGSIVQKIYRQGFDIPKVTPEIFKAAEAGDRISINIIKSAAEKLYEHLKPVSRKNFTVALCGSIFSMQRLLEKYLRFYVSRYCSSIKLIRAEQKPVWGAVRLAKENYNLQ